MRTSLLTTACTSAPSLCMYYGKKKTANQNAPVTHNPTNLTAMHERIFDSLLTKEVIFPEVYIGFTIRLKHVAGKNALYKMRSIMIILC
jgi:hypothetical protein